MQEGVTATAPIAAPDSPLPPYANAPLHSSAPVSGGDTVPGKWTRGEETRVALERGGIQTDVNATLVAAARLRERFAGARIEIDGNELVVRFRGTDQEARINPNKVV